MDLVRVLEHKIVSMNDEKKHMLKTTYVTYASIKSGLATLEEPKDKVVKELPRLMSDLEGEDFIFEKLNKKFVCFGEDLTEEEVLEKAKKLYLECPYYEVIEQDGILLQIKEVFDKQTQEMYDSGVVPSMAKMFENIISGNPDSFVLDANMTSQLLGQTNSLELQDTNKYKTMQDYNIIEMYHSLKEIVFGQDKQLKVFLANIIKNISLSYSELETEEIKRLKNTMLLVGPKGTGKTLMVESLATLLDVPYIVCDAKRYTSNAYVGEDIESVLLDLYYKSGEDKEKFEHGIICIDEFDKICQKKDEKSHVTTTDVQECLLKLLDGTVVRKTIRKGLVEEQLYLDTSKITFVFSGAFTSLFDVKEEITENSLQNYGMISELASRIRTMIVLNKPTKEDLKSAVLSGKYSYLNLWNKYLDMNNISYEIEEQFIDLMVDLAYAMDSGYRGLEKAVSAYIDEYLFAIISGEQDKMIYRLKNEK